MVVYGARAKHSDYAHVFRLPFYEDEHLHVYVHYYYIMYEYCVLDIGECVRMLKRFFFHLHEIIGRETLIVREIQI